VTLIGLIRGINVGEPEFKHTPVRLQKLAVEWHGFLLTRQRVEPPPVQWWAVSPGDGVVRMEFAGTGEQRPDGTWLRAVVPDAAGAQWIEYADAAVGNYRAALVRDGRLQACLMVVTRGTLPARAWLASLFTLQQLDSTDRRCLLLGQRQDAPDPGPTVCACFAVGSHAIVAAIRAGSVTIDAVGRQLKAGTNCGSCRPEIGRLVAAEAAGVNNPVPRSVAAG
jgi:assimilatory nitrate reductase catalytic subunit